jgi:glycosyltransferase involved in cell wall biosynthesis
MQPGMSAIRTLFVVPHGERAAGPRYRVFQYLPRLAALGVEPRILVVRPPGSTVQLLTAANPGTAKRAAQLLASWLRNQRAFVDVVRLVSRYDRVFIYRCPVPSWAARFLSAYRDRIIFDFDDALDQPELEGGLFQHGRVRVLRRGMENAVAVSRLTITSNRRNASVVRQLGGRVAVIPTCVDLDRAVGRDRSQLSSPRPVLGWIGTPTTARYLAGIEEPLVRLADGRPLRVRLIGAGASPFSGLDTDLRPWSLSSEPEDVAAFDVGLMPMPDTPWTRGKAALKALQYGASGLATVASWTETNAEILGDGVGTLLCRTGDEWLAALTRLLDDDAFRVEMGARARRRVELEYSLEVMAPRLYQAIATLEAPGRALAS